MYMHIYIYTYVYKWPGAEENPFPWTGTRNSLMCSLFVSIHQRCDRCALIFSPVRYLTIRDFRASRETEREIIERGERGETDREKGRERMEI